MKEWKILSIKATVDGDKRRVLKSTWVNGAGFELLYKYYIYAAKTHNKTARKKVAREEKNLMNYIQCICFLLPFLKWAYPRVYLSTGGLIHRQNKRTRDTTQKK